MEVILLADVAKLGKKGELVTVSDGYARNFLLKKKLAQIADSVNKNIIHQNKQSQEFHKQEQLNAFREVANKMKGITLQFSVKVGENGKLFGSVSSKEISEKLKELDFDIEKRKIDIEPIKAIGRYKAKVHFASGIESHFFVELISDKE